MAKREALRELQNRLAERMQVARSQQRGLSWLAVECRGQGLLFPLQQAGEIFPLVPLINVPHTQRWFSGVANLRGGLHGVVDLADFLGLPGMGPDTGAREQSRLVALNPQLGLNCALLVDRLAGLRNAEQLTRSSDEGAPATRPAFAGARFTDGAGRTWQEIVLSALAENEQFLAITA
jgi:twitching motility protein PilI